MSTSRTLRQDRKSVDIYDIFYKLRFRYQTSVNTPTWSSIFVIPYNSQKVASVMSNTAELQGEHPLFKEVFQVPERVSQGAH